MVGRGDRRDVKVADNELLVLWRSGRRQLTRAPKTTLARELIGLMIEVSAAQHGHAVRDSASA